MRALGGARVRRTYSRSGELGNYVLVRLVVRDEEGGHSLQGARDLGSGGARHRGRVGVGDVLGRLVGGVVLERRGLLLGSGRRRRLRLQGLVGVLRLTTSSRPTTTRSWTSSRSTTSRARSSSRARTSRTRRTAPPATPSTSASSTRPHRRLCSPPTKKPRRRRARATPTASACPPAARPILMDATRATWARCWAAR